MKASLSVSKRVVELGQKQIAVTGEVPEGINKKAPQLLCFKAGGKDVTLVQGDAHAIWQQHQANPEDFNRLYTALSANPGTLAAIEGEYKPADPISGSGGATVALDALL